jgi:ParB family chromosome partitioning protein
MALDLSALDGLPAAASFTRNLAPVAPPSAFEEDPDQPRFEFDEDDEFAALVEDVRQRGILQPLVVRRMPSGMLRIRFGARRYRAALRAGLAGIPYIETEDERQFDDYAQVAENARRQSLQPLELGRFVMRKLAAGEAKKVVADKLHIDASAITHLLALADDPPPLLLELYHSRRCRAPYYLYLLRKLLRQDAALVEHLVTAAAEIDHKLIEEMTQHLQQWGTAVPRSSAEPLGGGTAGAAAALPGGAEQSQVASGDAAVADRVIGDDRLPGVRSRRRRGPGGATLLGRHEGRELQLLLDQVPDDDAMVWVRFSDDGQRDQVSIGEVLLSAIRFRTD